MTTPQLLGYWKNELSSKPYAGMTAQQEESWARVREEALTWPDVHDFIDPNWSLSERQLVAGFLERGTLVNQYRGVSWCRLCKQENGSAELTDGVFCWPEGLAHYVWEHDVRLPERFVAHVHASPALVPDAPRPTFSRIGQRDRQWPGPEFAHQLWAPSDSKNNYGMYVEADPTWWREQAGWSGPAQ